MILVVLPEAMSNPKLIGKSILKFNPRIILTLAPMLSSETKPRAIRRFIPKIFHIMIAMVIPKTTPRVIV